VAIEDVVAALVQRWDDVLPYLEPEDLHAFADTVTLIESSSAVDQAAAGALANLMTLLIVRLPSGHPVREAIASQSRLAGPATASAEVARALRALPGISAALSLADPPAASGSQAAQQRLLEAPALTFEQVRERGGDPDRDDLIRLSPGVGPVRLPAFQFDAEGRPLPVVSAINTLLRAAEDPWGVADWWLGANAWLGAVPADLLGRVDDDVLARAAMAELPDR
jgi:hypothetical protein